MAFSAGVLERSLPSDGDRMWGGNQGDHLGRVMEAESLHGRRDVGGDFNRT